MRFKNREQAAQLLAEELHQYRGQNPLVLAIPRGAAPMARIIAESLKGEIDVVLVHKLGAPGEPELAIGAVDETGQLFLADYIEGLGINAFYIETEKQLQSETLRKRRAMYTPFRPPINPRDRIVIVVDNGIATGSTMIAALRVVRAKGPAKLIAAVAVAPRATLKKISAEADETICLEVPDSFYAVGEFFDDFSQVSDDEVVAILLESGARKRAVGE